MNMIYAFAVCKAFGLETALCAFIMKKMNKKAETVLERFN